MASALPRLAVTPGEPAGVGPELIAHLAASSLAADFVVIGDRELLLDAAGATGLLLALEDDDGKPRRRRAPGSMRIRHVPLANAARPGHPVPSNAGYVLSTLSQAADGCMDGSFAGVVTGPVQKATINDAGFAFSGHTEFFAERAACEVVMMLASPELKVTLATTHLPLSAVPAAITETLLERVLRIVDRALRERFGLAHPRIAVLG